MGKKARRRSDRTPHDVARRSQAVARPRSATSRSLPLMPYRSDSQEDVRPSTRVSRDPRRTPPAPKTPRRKPVPTLQALFGTWQLPTLPPKLKKAVQALKTDPCVQRQQRREVMFATRSTGAGALARRKHYTNKRCK